MNRYQFEDLISSYLENEITLSKRKEFESYMKDNPDSVELVSGIKDNIKKLNQVPRIKVKSSFNDTLKRKIDDLNNNPKPGKVNDLIFGFSPLNASFLSGLCIAFIIITFLLINPNFTYQQTSESKVVNNGLSNNLTTSRSPNKVIDSDLADVKDDTLKSEMNKKEKKDFTNKIQLVND
tara:strand:- start:14 stop:550 length:537 start_codon:yes stop_codon:yes gene_type:complete